MRRPRVRRRIPHRADAPHGPGRPASGSGGRYSPPDSSPAVAPRGRRSLRPAERGRSVRDSGRAERAVQREGNRRACDDGGRQSVGLGGARRRRTLRDRRRRPARPSRSHPERLRDRSGGQAGSWALERIRDRAVPAAVCQEHRRLRASRRLRGSHARERKHLCPRTFG